MKKQQDDSEATPGIKIYLAGHADPLPEWRVLQVGARHRLVSFYDFDTRRRLFLRTMETWRRANERESR